MRMTVANRLSAVVFLLLGLALLYGGYTMDRLEIRRIHPASIPGLVPMILGVLMSLCAVLLFFSSLSDQSDERVFSDGSWVRLGITAFICTGFALVLVGWLPYFWATFLFTLIFSLVFSFPVQGARRAQVISLVSAVALAGGAALGTSLLFAELFLVRLP